MSNRWRSLRAGWRDTIILLGEFQWPLILFTVAVLGGGIAYAAIADWVGEPVKTLGEAIFRVLSAAFLQSIGDFPQHYVLRSEERRVGKKGRFEWSQASKTRKLVIA